MPTPTPAQRAVLNWLRLYPSVRISWSGSQTDHRADIQPWWRDDAARQHMLQTATVLADAKLIQAEPDCYVGNPSGGTPRLTWQTFCALCRHGWIQAFWQRVPRENWSDMYYYQLTPAGKYALRLDRDDLS